MPPLPAFSVEPELCVVARRNDSLGTRGRRSVFVALAAVSLGLAVAFVAAGAWPVLPWSAVEIGALAVAFAALERRARDWERLMVQGDRVILEREWSGRRERREWNRSWLRVETTPGRDGRQRVMLHGAGPACEFGGLLPDGERREVARRLRRLTGI